MSKAKMYSVSSLFGVLGILLLSMATLVRADDDPNVNPGNMSPNMSKDSTLKMEKDALAPHSLMIQTQLETALNQVRGLKSQVMSMSAVNKDFIDHSKIYSKGINDDIKTEETHRGHLVSGVQKFPNIAQSDNFKSMEPALMNVESTAKDFKAKSSHTNYWNNKTQVISDLNQFEQQLTAALDKTKQFNQKNLDLQMDVG